MHACMHACIHTYIHDIHDYAHIYPSTYLSTHLWIHLPTCLRVRAHANQCVRTVQVTHAKPVYGAWI